MIVRRLAVAALLACATPAFAQSAPPAPSQDGDQVKYEEQVVVSASRTEEQLVNAPAAVTLITTETIENSPATNVGDLLRAVPGTNVTQVSARDVNITTRGATSTLATSQLTLVDGRSVYLDFFGMVMWDLVPTNPHEIRQIEVVRGPASAVWGANAMSGVVNVITRTPREMAATGGRSFTLGVGTFDRTVTGRDQDAGSLFYLNGSQAEAVNERWSYRVAAGYLTQDPLPRPAGTIPNAFNTPYPSFLNTGTSQPKFNARVDYDLASGAKVIVDGGVAGTEGIIHSGIGPFDIDRGSRLGYVTTRYEKGARHVGFFTNLLHGDADNLLIVSPNGQPLTMAFDTKTFDVDAGDVRAVNSRNVLSYGGNYRHNTFDISLAPLGKDRNEGGAYLQDEIFFGDHFRWVAGGRVDKFSSIDKAVFSPRTTFMYKPSPSQTVRASFNRAFRAPSFINNNIDVNVVTAVPLGPPIGLFPLVTHASGSTDLKQEQMTAYELGYTGVLAKRATVSGSVYWNQTENGIFFTPTTAYSPTNPPPGWPLPAAFVPPNLLTSNYSYLNLGKIHDKGIELGVDAIAAPHVNLFANYSFQWKPTIDEFPAGTSINDINWPARNRFNTGVNFDARRLLGNVSVNFTDSAYWQDVLDARFAGTTDSFTLVNGALGVKWMGEKLVTSLKVTNLANQEVMQHIFGDVIKRQVVGELRVEF
jgi:iron complex outermembrane receptor protein